MYVCLTQYCTAKFNERETERERAIILFFTYTQTSQSEPSNDRACGKQQSRASPLRPPPPFHPPMLLYYYAWKPSSSTTTTTSHPIFYNALTKGLDTPFKGSKGIEKISCLTYDVHGNSYTGEEGVIVIKLAQNYQIPRATPSDLFSQIRPNQQTTTLSTTTTTTTTTTDTAKTMKKKNTIQRIQDENQPFTHLVLLGCSHSSSFSVSVLV